MSYRLMSPRKMRDKLFYSQRCKREDQTFVPLNCKYYYNVSLLKDTSKDNAVVLSSEPQRYTTARQKALK